MDTIHYQTETLVEVAYKALKKDITERVLLPGQKINIRELYERYGISETPIKQALNRLIIEGLVENIPRKGMKVRNIKWEDIEEIMDIRLMIETFYVGQILQNFNKNMNIKSKLLKNLTEHKNTIEHITDVNDYFKNYYLDQEFHQLFISCSGNKRVMQIYDSLGTHAYSYYVYGKQDKSGVIEGVNEHTAVYEALVAQDETELRKRIEIHIINAKNAIYKMLKENLD